MTEVRDLDIYGGAFLRRVTLPSAYLPCTEPDTLVNPPIIEWSPLVLDHVSLHRSVTVDCESLARRSMLHVALCFT